MLLLLEKVKEDRTVLPFTLLRHLLQGPGDKIVPLRVIQHCLNKDGNNTEGSLSQTCSGSEQLKPAEGPRRQERCQLPPASACALAPSSSS